jgi:hypothetical protein
MVADGALANELYSLYIRKRDVLLWHAYHDLMSLLSTIKPDFAKPGCAWVKPTLPMNLT